ncbi:hypothetical protein [Xanthomonas arboricola]|uniref:hypothetical protein n=1 Tax=Xanthomonas arboricola TaxID=56448 RepID=UPI0015CADE0D
MSDVSTSALCSAKPVLLLLEHDSKIPSMPADASSVAMAGLLEAALSGIDGERGRLEVRRIGPPAAALRCDRPGRRKSPNAAHAGDLQRALRG